MFQLQQMLNKLEDQIRSRDKEISHLEKLLKVKDGTTDEESIKHLERGTVLNERVGTTLDKKRKGCIFNDRGHCRFGRSCFFQHFSEVCQFRQDCPYRSCEKRHPLPCRYGDLCQFGPNCSFFHINQKVEQTEASNVGKKNVEERIDNEEMNEENSTVQESESGELVWST